MSIPAPGVNSMKRSTIRCEAIELVTQIVPSAPGTTTATLGTGAASSKLSVEVVLFESHGAARTQPGPSASTAVTFSTTGAPGDVPTETGSGVSAGARPVRA